MKVTSTSSRPSTLGKRDLVIVVVTAAINTGGLFAPVVSAGGSLDGRVPFLGVFDVLQPMPLSLHFAKRTTAHRTTVRKRITG